MSDSEQELVIDSDQEEEALERDVESLRELLEAETKAKKGTQRTFDLIIQTHRLLLTRFIAYINYVYLVVVGATDEDSSPSSATVHVVEQLQLCLSNNQELQVCIIISARSRILKKKMGGGRGKMKCLSYNNYGRVQLSLLNTTPTH